ncbi:calcium/sodium antiporter [Jannaschia ovalis]|uniref:Calcium/sodium antiporter n=1 Tax=Jannaschia ovalis TaxID=3038773 RepID=A0ABY8LGK4_9RHOB|nr:calcium/sodium antiporter [Jannaschia sp. GRR-S6-38]WGH80441.1 calcium/sodium antiporter [Jannaschia sp. GRR-S6-38]
MIDIAMMLGGLVLLLLGGGWLVTGAVGLALRWGLSPLVIGVTLVGMGTSLPELLTSLRAAQQGAAGLALGNVVGSNTANILLILGLSALLAAVPFPRATMRSDGWPLLAISAAGALWIGLAGGLDRLSGAVFLAVFALWLWQQIRSGGVEMVVGEAPAPLGRGLALAGLGFAGVLLGAELLVRGAIATARDFGVSEAVIGLTIVAVGTSLPELATSVMAVRKGRGDLALGNVLGSNVFNLLGILGVTALVVPFAAPPRFAALDLPVMVATVALMLALAWRGSLGRLAGCAMLAAYGLYLWQMA